METVPFSNIMKEEIVICNDPLQLVYHRNMRKEEKWVLLITMRKLVKLQNWF